MENSCPISYNVLVELMNPNGDIIDRRESHNVLCQAGKNKVLAVAGGESVAVFTYTAIGSGTTAPLASDVSLQYEIARVTAILSNPLASSLQSVATYGPGVGTGSVTEAGLFDASVGGNILAHDGFGVITKGANDTLTITWTIT